MYSILKSEVTTKFSFVNNQKSSNPRPHIRQILFFTLQKSAKKMGNFLLITVLISKQQVNTMIKLYTLKSD
ncbi:hypothetical protein GCM10027347_37810 [Larkinella harenae]